MIKESPDFFLMHHNKLDKGMHLENMSKVESI